MNLCVNNIKRIRELPSVETDDSVKNYETKKQSAKPLTDTYAKVAAQLAGSVAPSRTVIRPPTLSLAKTEKKHSSLVGGKPEVKRRSSITVDELSGKPNSVDNRP